ncbi:MAG: ATP-dependent protease La [Candidatus Woesebacteria bacterium GW2011_GWA1_33_30]|uniref:Lon protease n=1 Tax=Candidatus Woesebacteria bacterium GW2011_GWA2_33_28 TaxID=1618561 RepID=A0A0F9ZUZ6_9BACT|nr:MAG: ATP-dependent protease La [Candidatus Woesebacteria bacterium GW2011_GWA2_33_28]KKP48976.1 MAG: ATP-dependent protease La [Candidatus Woesebacteria bacterium GW2011_GWA1_33_30]KKP49917.1 MAG: ATP-dependent protease La [Microgenomates group bacterium GW2011_GWC1_33_32]KKP52567.1 MAG: ATP-dependent protease La [Candidatus Woesebacteria bacterium GW2011_GWB1_33_38]KKP56499.1 MAG: ATP-dependent protease La [Microgenomates group bacterium GW2011_GWD1_33_9]
MIRSVPIAPIRGSVVFPHTDTLLSFVRQESVSALEDAFNKDRLVAIFTQKDSRIANPTRDDLYQYGTLATVTQMMSVDDGIHALVRGQVRVKLSNIVADRPYLIGAVEEIPDVVDNSSEVQALSNSLSELFKKALTLGKSVEVLTVVKLISENSNPVELSDQIAATLNLKLDEKQILLQTFPLIERMKKVQELLTKEINVLEIEKKISSNTQKQFDDNMKKNILRERKKAIEKELGEIGGEDGEIATEEVKEYKKKIADAKMPKDVEEKALKELNKLSKMSSYNPESGFLRNYLDWLCEVPWSVVSSNNVSIPKASKIMEKRHYGLKKTKERILEYLSVMKLLEEQKKKGKEGRYQPTILCFIGPPGVGKTSIGRAIAEAMGRKFARISLGGIRDEAEIRGHRRTYVGALPGRIIQGIKTAGTKNPIFMLDEIDKVGADFRGDPSSALLEALDPEQNHEFSDHYLEVPFDLSKVFFIATGNVVDTIPSALKDRMEIINFAGYTEEEKFEIGERFIWPKQLKNHGLDEVGLTISDKALKEIINRYTREAGVRNLERNIATIMRKIARLKAEKKIFPKVINSTHILKFLGPHKFSSLIAEKKNEVGMATGLAVTNAGGEILFIEVSLMPGKGRLTLTGQLGDVMKESAQAAFTWTRSNYKLLGLKPDFASKMDVHIHVPEGAVPKDGPSAGTSITTALVSALTKIPSRRDTGMTGEITLRGNVMEIGGVKEKTIAGHRAGLKTIIIPKENKKDMEEVPQKVRKDINFVFAEKIEDVLKVALTKWPIVKANL